MNALFLLASMAGGGAGGLDGQSWTIITALATAVVAEAVYIRYLIGKLDACQDARVKGLEDQLSLVRTAKREMKPENGGQ